MYVIYLQIIPQVSLVVQVFTLKQLLPTNFTTFTSLMAVGLGDLRPDWVRDVWDPKISEPKKKWRLWRDQWSKHEEGRGISVICILPSGKLTWQWNVPIFERNYIFMYGSFSIAMSVYRSVHTHTHTPIFNISSLISTSQVSNKQFSNRFFLGKWSWSWVDAMIFRAAVQW